MAADAAALRAAFTRLGFSEDAREDIIDVQGIDSLAELKILTDSEVENLCKVVRRPGGAAQAAAAGAAQGAAAGPNLGHQVSLRAENNLKLATYYLRHRDRISRATTAADITLPNVRALRELRQMETDYKKSDDDLPKVDSKDWAKTMEDIRECLRARLGVTKIPLAYVIRDERIPPAEVTDPSTNYATVQDEMIARAPHGTTANNVFTPSQTFIADREEVFEVIASITRDHECWTYVKEAQKTRDGRKAYRDLFDHYLGPNNVDNAAATAEEALASCTYNGEGRRWNFEKYVTFQKKQHSILEGLVPYGYAGIDPRTKTRYLMDGIKTDALDSATANILASPELRNDYDKCVTLYKDLILQKDKGGSKKRTLAISAVQVESPKRIKVEDRYYSAKEYSQLNAEQRKALQAIRAKRGHQPGDKSSKVPVRKAPKKGIKALTKQVSDLQRNISQLTKKLGTGDLQLDDVDSTSEDTPETSNRTNPALQRKGKKD